jgi:hypothetical protein
VILLGLLVVAAAVVAFRRRPADGFAAGLLRALDRLSSGARHEWIAAMVAEHESIHDPRARRAFARGCLCAALRHPSSDRTETAVGAAVIVPIAAAGALAAVGLVRYPWVRTGSWWPLYTALFACALAACGVGWWIVARLSSRTAALVAVALAPATALCSWMAMRSASSLSVSFALLPAVFPAAAVSVTARHDHSRERAAVAAVCGAIVVSLLFFVGAVATTYLGHPPHNTTMLAEFAKSGAPDYRTWVVADNLSGAAVMLVLLAVAGLASGTLAAVGRVPRRRSP